MGRISNAIISLITVVLCLAGTESRACTNVLVTKGASTDGSNLISYAADSHQLHKI